jgi:hypothetical protein
MCVGSVCHGACNAWSMGLLQLIALTIEMLEWDSNFELSPASGATRVNPIDPILVSVVACALAG